MSGPIEYASPGTAPPPRFPFSFGAFTCLCGWVAAALFNAVVVLPGFNRIFSDFGVMLPRAAKIAFEVADEVRRPDIVVFLLCLPVCTAFLVAGIDFAQGWRWQRIPRRRRRAVWFYLLLLGILAIQIASVWPMLGPLSALL